MFREWFINFIQTHDWEPMLAVEKSMYFRNLVSGDMSYWEPHLHMLTNAGIDDLSKDAHILDLGTWFGVMSFCLKQYGFTNVHCSERMSESEFKRKEFDILWKEFDIQPYDLSIEAEEKFELPQVYDLILIFESNFYWKTNQVFCYDGFNFDGNWQVTDNNDTVQTFFSPFNISELKYFNNTISKYLTTNGAAIVHPRPWVYSHQNLSDEQEYLATFQTSPRYVEEGLSNMHPNTNYYVVTKS